MYKTLFEKTFVLVLGAWLTYFMSVKLLEKYGETDNSKVCLDFYVSSLKRSMKLNKYEQWISEDIVEKTDYTMDDIVGHETIKKDIIQTVIKPLNENYDKLPNGILLHGGPGTGKTLIAKCIADSVKANFIQFNVANIENKYYGESSKCLNAVFTLAKKIEPCIIFIDEIDGFCGERNPMEQHHVNSLKTQFLSLVDGLDSKSEKNRIVCIGATNKLSYIDKAVKRRMRKHIHLDLPDKTGIRDLFKLYLPEELFQYVSDETLDLCVGLSGSDVYELSKDIDLNVRFNDSETTETTETAEEIVLRCILRFNDETDPRS